MKLFVFLLVILQNLLTVNLVTTTPILDNCQVNHTEIHHEHKKEIIFYLSNVFEVKENELEDDDTLTNQDNKSDYTILKSSQIIHKSHKQKLSHVSEYKTYYSLGFLFRDIPVCQRKLKIFC